MYRTCGIVLTAAAWALSLTNVVRTLQISEVAQPLVFRRTAWKWGPELGMEVLLLLEEEVMGIGALRI